MIYMITGQVMISTSLCIHTYLNLKVLHVIVYLINFTEAMSKEMTDDQQQLKESGIAKYERH